MDCDGGGLELTGQAYLEMPDHLIQPGAVYHLSVRLSNTSNSNMTAQMGLYDGYQTTILEEKTGMAPSTYVDFEGEWAVDAANGDRAYLHVYCSEECGVSQAKIKLLPTRYRVTEKRVYDGIETSPGTFTYRYDEGAANDETHSEAVSEGDTYVKPHYEFRGHAMVREESPSGQTVTQ